VINIYFQLTNDDKPYLFRLKQVVSGRANGKLNFDTQLAAMQTYIAAKQAGCSCIATTSQKLLNLLLGSPKKAATLNDYAGSIISFKDMEFLILNPLQHLISTSYGEFLFRRYLDKFIHPEKFIQIPEFDWTLFEEKDTAKWLEIADTCNFMSYDIETGRPVDRVITCIGFTFVFMDPKKRTYELKTLVIPMTSEYNLAVVRHILSFSPYKITQNGKYDNAYLLRYNAPAFNWLGDTAHLFHSWYAELPKRLDFIVSFEIRKWQFWKDESSTINLMDEYKYNAKDAFVTAITWIGLLAEIPDWALENYIKEFPLVFPCLLTEMTGVKRDNAFFEKELDKFQKKLDERKKKLQIMVANPLFNPSSPVQTLRVFQVLGSGDIKDTQPANMDKVKHRHALNMRILDEVIEYRKDRKLETSYLSDEESKPKEGYPRTKSWFSRILYSLNPHGTDTTRLASKESAFWCGWQIQNIPRDREDIQIKAGIIADTNFYFGEGDYSQNETWGTAYLSGDSALITAIEDKSRDFHGRNASSFFGIPYDEIVRSVVDENGNWKHTTIAKAIRDVSKRTNHGANYNMTAPVLLATMTISKVIQAKKLLKLPYHWTLMKVCEHLLDAFDETYPIVRGKYYDKIKADIKSTKMLIGPTGLVRYCFGDPSKSKRDMNRYAAHGAQSLGAQELNEAFMKVFYNVYLPNPNDFRLYAQIHDSILFGYRKGREDLAYKVKEEMRVPIDVTNIFGVKHHMIVPVELKGEGTKWSELKVMN
jgi:DNA polymerase I-like protein with 3'-5' exonuclease and polymerase domains